MTTEKNNFFLNNTTRVRVFNEEEPDPNKNYIILQNDLLHAKNNTLEQSNHKLSSKIECQEDEVDKLEIQLRYMRGELKNVFELKNMAVEMASEYKNKEKIYIDQNIDFQQQLRLMCFHNLSTMAVITLSFGAMCMANVIPYYQTLVAVTIIFSGLLCNALFHKFTPNQRKLFKTNYNIRNLRLEEHSVTVAKIQKEIVKTEDANDFISKYIDSI